MARIVLVTGGCRSGKSAYAQQMAESLPPVAALRGHVPGDRRRNASVASSSTARPVATAAGRRSKSNSTWPASFAATREHNVLLVDCVTLWVNNLMYEAERRIASDHRGRRCRAMRPDARRGRSVSAAR